MTSSSAAARAAGLLQQASLAPTTEDARALSRQAYSALKDARDAETDVQLKSVLSTLVDHHRDLKRADFSALKNVPAAAAGAAAVAVEELPSLAHAPTLRFSKEEAWTEIKTVKRGGTLEHTSSELAVFMQAVQADKDRLLAQFEQTKAHFHLQTVQFKAQTRRRKELQNALAKQERAHSQQEEA